jgi:murein tripeptide amidase MpaA
MAWDAYQQLDTIYSWLDELAATYDFVSVEVIGSSFEGRDMKVLQIAKPSSDGSPKLEVFIEAHTHAREWITSATVTWMINEILTTADYDDILDVFNLHIVVVSNPDGFQYTHEANRMWRKTRAETDSFFGCKGIDGNRNWDSYWGEAGSSGEPCSDTYHGPSANSEPETQAMVNYCEGLVSSTGQNLSAFLSVHSYSQLILLPWSHTANPKPPNFDELMEVSGITAEALKARYGTEYTYGNSVEILYAASGGSFDWGMEKVNARFAMGFELRDTGHYGFVLPAEQIVPSGEETLDGFAALLRYIAAAERK